MKDIERAARAAAEQYGEDWERLPEINPVANGDLDRRFFVEQARAVLEVFREPSAEMIEAALLSTPSVSEGHLRFFHRDFRTEFGAAIDVVLEGEPA